MEPRDMEPRDGYIRELKPGKPEDFLDISDILDGIRVSLINGDIQEAYTRLNRMDRHIRKFHGEPILDFPEELPGTKPDNIPEDWYPGYWEEWDSTRY